MLGLAIAGSAALITGDDYPAEALKNAEQGKVTVELMVGEDGAPRSCKVTLPSASIALNEATCSLLLQRAHYTPANASTPRVVTQTINWKIPPADPISAIKTGVVASVSISATGAISGCKETSFGDKRIGALELCGVTGDPKTLAYLIGGSLIPGSTAFVRIYVEPFKNPTQSIEVNSKPTKNHKLAEAAFEIAPTGFVTTCKTTFIDPHFPVSDVCSAFSKTDPDFERDDVSKAPRKMMLILDAGSIVAEPQKAVN